MISSMETVIYTCVFLVPGAIITEIVGMLQPGKRITETQRLVRWLTFSIVNNCIWGWLYYLIIRKGFDQWVKMFVIVVLVILTSIVLGVAISLLNTRNLPRKIAKRLNINVEHPIPTAWEYVFSRRSSPCFIIVGLKDGTQYYGYFGTNSFASSDIGNQDLFIEGTYKLDEEQRWVLSEGTEGVWINGSEIMTIEIKSVKEAKNEKD